jgi:hypothetical protein
MIWKTPKSPAPVNAKQNKSAKKFMFIFFMDSEGLFQAIKQSTHYITRR